jgi:DNA modification methylase
MKIKHISNNSSPANDNILNNIEDEHFIAELGSAFLSLKTIQQRMNASGHPTTPEMICERMNEFVEHGGGTIERRGKSWRIVPTGEEIDAPVEKPSRTMPPPVCDLGIKQTLNLQHGDCLDLMKLMPDRSVNLLLGDLPYGCTKNDFDIPVEMAELWSEIRRVIAPRGTIIMFAKQPFSSLLVAAAPDLFKYSMVWQKPVPTGSQLCASQPLRYHEDILVFSPGTAVHKSRSKRTMTYNPQGLIADGKAKYRRHANAYMGGNVQSNRIGEEYVKFTNWPSSVLYFPKDRVQRGTKRHPFAKPVALLEYLIHTYSNPGDSICDPTMGGGSAAIAALNTGRHFVGFELMEKWFRLAESRVANWTAPPVAVPVIVARIAANDDIAISAMDAPANDVTPVQKRKSRKPRVA